MRYLASVQAQAFYVDDLEGQQFPADAVEITPEQHAALLHAMNHGGQALAFGQAGEIVTIARAISAADELAALKAEARAALVASDKVALRCAKAGVAYPPSWQAYDADLRSVLSATSSVGLEIPVHPQYPAGT